MTLRERLRRNSNSLSFRLLLALGLILFVCQAISVLWLWHESKEQIHLLVDAAVRGDNNHRHIEREIREAIASLAVPSLVIIGLALVLCLQAVKWITRPLRKLQDHLENRTEDNLEPIQYLSSVQEIDAVTLAINQLLSRLTTSLERERLFTADVAHELRTPLAGLRLHLELLERNNHVQVQPLIARLDQMTRSVVQLLQLARAGQSFTSGNYQDVSLTEDVVLATESELRTMLAQRDQTLRLRLSPQARVRGDTTLLQVLLRNLVENAHRYSPQGSVITVSVAATPVATLIVEDEGDGVDESKVGELSKAFVRMDRRYGGIGLGLNIVSRIVQLHKGEFLLENRAPECGSRATARFPGNS